MDKGVAVAAFIVFSLANAVPELRFGLGQTAYADPDFRFQANQGFTECTLNPDSRLQFGLKYESTGVLLDKRRRFAVRGFLGSLKIYLNTVTRKTPYFGANFGWLNTEVTADKYLYTARGVWAAEFLAGYSFRLDELNRINIEYNHQAIEDAYAKASKLEADTWSLVWGLTLGPFPESPVRSQTPAEGITTRKEYLSRKIAYNNEQIAKYDLLIAKYNQKILATGQDEDTQKERDYLLTQKQGLENDNRQMLELLEK
ncbi:hypothetical protein NO2_0663 [Candidatus Termititenax persephonae]|uniref:Outer membrane protein beta-barrel domain-containing protein n=1 Tax=Candidatus Termititenax persephonae TaxID=2218525 RepID=A0A388TGV4_9BACT|nr:hypothetical protein NO2_0663 [Candidatus Termititenax persephonae]